MRRMCVYMVTSAALLMCVFVGSSWGAQWSRVDHGGFYIVAISDDYCLTRDGQIWRMTPYEWMAYSGPYPPVPVDQLAYWTINDFCIDVNGNMWFCNTDGVWFNRGPIPGFQPSGVESPTVISSRLQLGTSPNPSQRAATINYVLPEAADVLVQVSDVSGRVVDVLVNQSQSAGTHSQAWEPKDAPAGIYFVVMIAQGEMRSCKVVLTK